MKRREFIVVAGAGAIGCALRLEARERLNILVLGGTNFLGPAVVRRALSRGHTVTLFNRGITNPKMFPELELIRGDRSPQATKGLAALDGSRQWQAVIDVWPDNPAIVEPTLRLLADRTDYYFFVSSIAAYAPLLHANADEDSPLRTGSTGYGGGKAESERLLARLRPGRYGTCRPSSISGRLDPSLTYYYWLSRAASAGPHIAPGDGSDLFQLVDVEDVATWIVDSVEQKRSGAYNTTGETQTWRAFLDETLKGIHGSGKWVWVGAKNLAELGLSDRMPAWAPRAQRGAFFQISSERALAAGWTRRPTEVTAKDAWASYQQLFPLGVTFPHTQYGNTFGVSSDEEKTVLNSVGMAELH